MGFNDISQSIIKNNINLKKLAPLRGFLIMADMPTLEQTLQTIIDRLCSVNKI